MTQQLSIPETLVNVTKLREEALNLSQTSCNKPVTLRERIVIAIIVTRTTGRSEHHVLNAIREDLLSWEIPKYTALVGWLAPHSLVSVYPNAIIAVARYLLGHTRADVEASVDWDAVRQQFPQL